MANSAPEFHFTEVGRLVLLSMMDAFFADLGEAAAKDFAANLRLRVPTVDEDELVAFARRPASASADDMVSLVAGKITSGPVHDGEKLRVLFKALSSRLGCKVLTGKLGPFYKLSTSDAQEVIKSWLCSPLAPMREIGKSMKLLAAFAAMALHPNWKAIGYARPDLQAMRESARKMQGFDFSACRVAVESPQPMPSNQEPQPQEIICDCVVVGSGPGGAVLAAELTEAGFRVALLEVGQWQSSETQTCSEREGFRAAYQMNGNLFTEHKDLTILAGSALGGGSAVNWSCCLPPPQQVREEWARDFGIEWAASEEMQQSVEQVRQRLAMHTKRVKLNAANQVLMRGCERLGYQSEVAAQQGWEPESPDNGGLCSLGWKHGSRQGMHGSALADAARTGNLLLLDGCRADEILRDSLGRACAVCATVHSGPSTRQVIVRGRGVVVAGGTLQTPQLLRRSGLKNKHIGRHLHLHPAMLVWGRFDEEIRHFEGAPMTTVSRVAEDQDGRGYGAKIFVPNFHPVTFSALTPWQGAKEFKESLTGYAHAAPLLSLVRDQGEGKVWEDAAGNTRVDYTMTSQDKKHLMSAGEHAARILVAAGAREVHSSHSCLEPFRVRDSAAASSAGSSADFEAWLARLQGMGIQQNSVALGSAHQMGTCRMAASPKLGAVKPSGETWEVFGLFVADTSAFPTASGVNPMWTCAALAHRVAQQVKQHLGTTPEQAMPAPLRRHFAPCAAGCASVPVPSAKPKQGLRHVEDASTNSGSSCTSSPGSSGARA